MDRANAGLKRSLPFTLALAAVSSPAFAQSQGGGDISAAAGQFSTLGRVILNVFLILAGIGFVGVIVAGALQLGPNRPKGLSMITGGLVGALVMGVVFLVVNHLTGTTVQTG